VRTLEVLANGPRSVSELAQLLRVEHQFVSKHVTELHRAGLLTRKQAGNFAVYSLPNALALKAVALVVRSVRDDRARLAALADEASANGSHSEP
jgi:DNA-binding transcriptional ArsR family regulator